MSIILERHISNLPLVRRSEPLGPSDFLCLSFTPEEVPYISGKTSNLHFFLIYLFIPVFF